MRTTHWATPQTVVIFPASYLGLDPIEQALARPGSGSDSHISKELSDYSPEQVARLPFPRLAPFLRGMARRFLDTNDDVARIAVEQLVDGMDLSQTWVKRKLDQSEADVLSLVARLVRGKRGRLDTFSDNIVTCFVRDLDEANRLPLIPGYQ